MHDILHRKCMITHPPFPYYIFNIIFVNIVPGTSYIRPSVLLSKGSALSLWFLSCAWYTSVPVLSVFIPKLVLVMVLKFSLPRLHRKNMTSNHTFCCRPTGVFGFRATLQYICFRSSGSIVGGSTLASPVLFISTVTAWNTSLTLLKSGSCIMLISSSREKTNTFKCRNFVRCTVLFLGHLCKSFSVILPAAPVSSHTNSDLCRLQ